MKTYLSVVWLVSMTSGCSHLGYYKAEKAEYAPAEEAASVRFPDSMEEGLHLSGPTLSALRVALDDFLPPGSELTSTAPEQRVAACLSRRSTYDTLLLPRDDAGPFFVAFVPDLKRCGLNEEVLDGGAVYAIDAKGRILDRR